MYLQFTCNGFGVRQQMLLSFSLLISITTSAQQFTDRVRLNQVGFYTASPKIAIVTGEITTTNFYITSTNLRDTFLTGVLGKAKQSMYSKTITRIAEFSSFKKAGSYVVVVPALGHSYVFKITDDVYHDVAVATLKGFYYQRVSLPLEPVYAGKWHRSAGHPDDIVYVHSSAVSKKRPAGTIISNGLLLAQA